MTKTRALISLIRFKNLLIIITIQVVIKFFLIHPYLNNAALSNFNFLLYLVALITIIASGYIINDIYDVEIDTINKRETRIIEKEISKDFAMKLYYFLNLTGIISGFYVSYQVNRLWFGFIFVFFIFSLWKYSKDYKTSFLIGNLHVAFLTALSILNIALFDLIPLGITEENGSKIIFYIIIFYASFSFITTLIREIIKDIEDVEGDKKAGATTLVINYGLAKAKKITLSLILSIILIIFCLQYFQYKDLSNNLFIHGELYWKNLIANLYTLLLQSLLILLLIRIKKSYTKLDFHSASTLCKSIMLIGILSIPLFHFLYEN
jgi:4-hydroxybenzoate polyprenyltransferase